MKDIVFFSFLFILLTTPLPAKAQSENIINGGFETGALAPWEYLGVATETPPGIVLNTHAYGGSYSLEIGGYTARIIQHQFSSPVVPRGTFSFFIHFPADIDPCDIIFEICTPNFTVSIVYEDVSVHHNITSQLTGGPVWKQIVISLDTSKKVEAVIFTTSEINSLYVDEVSLPSFPWPIYFPAFIKNT